MSVPTVPFRSMQRSATRSNHRSHRSLSLREGNVGNADLSNLVPMPLFLSEGVTVGITVSFSLPKKWWKNQVLVALNLIETPND